MSNNLILNILLLSPKEHVDLYLSNIADPCISMKILTSAQVLGWYHNQPSIDLIIIDDSEFEEYSNLDLGKIIKAPTFLFSEIQNTGASNLSLTLNKEASDFATINYIIKLYIEEKSNLLKLDLAENKALSKLKFYANMSHEIRTPLNGVIGFLDILKECLAEPVHLKYLSLAREAATHLNQIINDLLDFSKIETHKLELNIKEDKIKDSFLATVNICRIKADEKNINLIFEWDENIPKYLLFDQLRLKQVIFNILGNAVKFTGNSGTVSLTTKFINSNSNIAEIYCEISDSGIGIPEDSLSSIFDPFSKVTEQTQADYGGTGLGLSITKKLIEQMGGDIKVASTYGKGSNFCFNLQLLKSNKNLEEKIPTSIANNRTSKMKSTNQKKILVAEDNLINQKLIKAILSVTDFYSIVVSDGAQALTEMNNQKFDLVLMDINMPVLDGLQASKQIRDLELNNEHIPIIALSAEAESDCMGLLEQFGIDNYLPKPINRQDLLNLLNSYLS